MVPPTPVSADVPASDHAGRAETGVDSAPVGLAAASRRTLLLLGLGMLAGCSTSGSRMGVLPGTPWDGPRTEIDADRGTSLVVRSGGEARDDEPGRSIHSTRTTGSAASTTRRTSRDLDRAGAASPRTLGGPLSHVYTRATWASSGEIPSRMDAMTRPGRITIHHDGMSAFHATDAASGLARIDAIRRVHQSKSWGDIGYHFVIDRAGRVFEGRRLRWQGAHVKYHNPGNIGICCLGNFEVQSPSRAQVEALRRHVAVLARGYRIDSRAIRTHRELRPTLCPGRTMQASIDGLRRVRAFG